jgi:hemerythrin-like domain-containing protein
LTTLLALRLKRAADDTQGIVEVTPMLRDPSLIPLSHQHHNGLALCVMTRRSLAADSSEENLAKLARRVIDRYEIELVNHFEIEEQVLFPACGPMDLIEDLVWEHSVLAGMVAGLRNTPSASGLEDFCKLLSYHIRREENELFERIQREMPKETLDRVGLEIDRRAVRVCLD